MRSRTLAAISISVLITATACGPTEPGGPAATVAGTDPSGTAASPSLPGGGDTATESAWTPVAEDGVLLLNEIGFRPAPGDGAFVEIVNAGGSAASAAGLVLAGGPEARFTLPADAPVLEPGGLLVVGFGPVAGLAGPMVQGSPRDLARGDAGSITLIGSHGTVLDTVAWGGEHPGGVALGRGGMLPDPLPGATIGRVPGDASTASTAWSYFGPDESTPGRHNPRPTASLLLPIDGAEIAGPAPLAWYPVGGAAAYTIEVASDPGFSDVVASATTDTTTFEADLAPGTYFWRVRAVGADGIAAGLSGISRITITNGPQPQALAANRPAGPVTGDPASLRQAAAASLGVPLIAQHKDTGMLELQSIRASGAHAWDRDHGALDQADPSDNMNCVLASAVMVNRFFGGSLSQDRLGYQVLQPMAAGPETDLNYGRGFYPREISEALSYALGGRASGWRSNGDTAGIWRTVTGEIDAGRPVVAFFVHAGGGHVVVVSGYQQRADGGRFLEVSDPWGPVRYVVPLQAGAQSELDGGVAASLDYYFVLPPAPAAGEDEPGVSADTDGDGVVDFDETNRFGTNPGNPDTDGDGVGDFEEIAATVFDPTHGAAATGSFAARDLDGDGSAMELDEDSDDGGCSDGLEDSDRDGEYVAGSETSNFDPADDACYRVEAAVEATNGPATLTFSYTGSFIVQADGSLLGNGTGHAIGHDTAAPCVDLDAGEVREITSHTEGPFSFEVGGTYRTDGSAAGRLPLPDDPDPEFGLLFPLTGESFSTTVSDCELEDDLLFTHLLSTYAGNISWLIGEFQEGIVAAADRDTPPYPVSSQLLPDYTGEITISIEKVQPGGG